jgi:hypothetical protein
MGCSGPAPVCTASIGRYWFSKCLAHPRVSRRALVRCNSDRWAALQAGMCCNEACSPTSQDNLRFRVYLLFSFHRHNQTILPVHSLPQDFLSWVVKVVFSATIFPSFRQRFGQRLRARSRNPKVERGVFASVKLLLSKISVFEIRRASILYLIVPEFWRVP